MTGGPGGGKSEAIKYLMNNKQEIETLGYEVVFIQELATKMLEEGTVVRDDFYAFQHALIEAQIKYENEAVNALNDENNAIIICDRGIIDSLLFTSDETYAKLVRDSNLTEKEAENNYDFVYHMVSLAREKPELYERSTNAQRAEDMAAAAAADEKAERCFCNHPGYRKIDTSHGVPGKYKELLKLIIKDLN